MSSKENKPKNKAKGSVKKVSKKSIKLDEEKNKRIIAISIIIALLVVLGILLFSTMFAFTHLASKGIIGNVYVFDVNLRDLSMEDAENKIQEEMKKRLGTDIVLTHDDERYSFVPTGIQAEYNKTAKELAKEAYSLGRTGNIFENNYAIVNLLFNEKELDFGLNYNEEILESIIPQMNEHFKDGVRNPAHEIDGETLKIYPGRDGVKAEYEELRVLILDKLIAKTYSDSVIEIPVEQTVADKIDMDKIYKEVYRAPVNASYTTNPYTITASKTGIDFAVTIDEAKEVLKEEKECYEVPLKILYPEVTTNMLDMGAFPNLLSEYVTDYSSSGANRATNVALATEKINGTVLMPGEVFSFNDTVGRRTPEAGFKQATVYVNGGVGVDYGGGICQVSSTLYNAVLLANLEIVFRTNHEFEVDYVPIGQDATVSWGYPDFQFKNNRDYPIKIVASPANRDVYMAIYGLATPDDPEVIIDSYRVSSIPYSTTYTTDRSLAKGTSKIVQYGSSGCESITYKILKKNGEVISKEEVSYDYYEPHNEVIARNY